MSTSAPRTPHEPVSPPSLTVARSLTYLGRVAGRVRGALFATGVVLIWAVSMQ